jgi:sterol desaturase/sphingolipid hydroxylase (fatty acid hydroxylase superfamily)
MTKIIYFALQPLILLCVIAYWLMNPESPATYPVAIIGTQIVLGVLEHWRPARTDWVIHAKQKLQNILAVLVLATLGVFVALFYANTLAQPLTELRESLGVDIWPHNWPVLVQLFMVFFLAEFMWYWMHRAEHRWHFVWRISGHGAHHAFKKLNALNFGLNHPLELFFLTLPSALIELFFGVGVAAAGATILTVTQASIAHANVSLNTRGIGWLFTTNRYHIRHHSVVLEQSNTNYGCAAIVWDRLFGTFVDSSVDEAGTGPTEPSMWQKFLMPWIEPADTAIAPGHSEPQTNRA